MGQALGELDRRRGGIPPEREIPQRAGLPRGRLGEFGPAVTDLHHEQPGQGVQIALAAVVEDGDAVAADDDRVLDAGTVPGEVQPKVSCRRVGERSARLGQ
ncbi:Uncharacterised protein [Mycobacterium tuberculosis]|nr:Uncharacterised protein [Mycobacterium tuberculosis]CNV32516.1 Uncharacterised protein [Mycobacterium tuberculosis]